MPGRTNWWVSFFGNLLQHSSSPMPDELLKAIILLKRSLFNEDEPQSTSPKTPSALSKPLLPFSPVKSIERLTFMMASLDDVIKEKSTSFVRRRPKQLLPWRRDYSMREADAKSLIMLASVCQHWRQMIKDSRKRIKALSRC